MMLVDTPSPVVIVVDDDAALANALSFAFGIEGFDVRTYGDAESLLAAGDYPDQGCLVLDYRLPGLDGLSLLGRLRDAHVALPAILVTTNPRADLRSRAAAAGTPIVEKPLLTDALLKAVRQAVQMASRATGRPA